jgi:DNA polymerase-3 subunit alpha
LSDRRAEAQGQDSLFGGDIAAALEIDEKVLRGPEFEKSQLLRFEKEMLGQYVTDHPLLPIKERLAAQTDMEIVEAPSLGDGDVVTVAGIVGAVGRRYTKRGEPYAVFRLEDLTGGVGVVAFPSVFDRVPHLMTLDAIVLVRGRADLRGRELQLVALEIREPDLTGTDSNASPRRPAGPAGVSVGTGDPLVVDVPSSACTPGLIRRMKDLFALFPGATPVVVRLVGEEGVVRLRLGSDFCVDGVPALVAELSRLLGDGAVRLQIEGGSERASRRSFART